MNKALCFFLIGCVILAVLFGFASSYDYTFDTTSPQLDLTECRDINAGLLSMSFARVIKFGGNVTNVLNKVVASVYNLFSPFSTEQQTEDDLTKIQAIYDSSLAYINANYSFLKKTWTKFNLKSFKAFLDDPNSAWSYQHLSFLMYNLEDAAEAYGISDENKLFLHNYFERLKIRHIYEGEVYSY